MEKLEIPFLEEFGKAFLPKRYHPIMNKYLAKAGVYQSPYALIGILFYFSLILTGIIEFFFVYPRTLFFVKNTFGVNQFSPFIIGIAVFITWTVIQLTIMATFFLTGYFFLDLRIYKRVHEIELILPDFLVSVSTNLKGGMGLESALWNSIKPKFGIISHEITLVSKKVMTGRDVVEGLAEFAEKYPSPELKRTMGLIISEFEIGGKITDILDDIVDNLKNTQKLKKQLQASVVSYVIFIGAIVIFIAPVLFALSYNLISFISGFMTKVSGALSTSNAPSFLAGMTGGETVDPEGFRIFGYYAVATISIISSMIVSIIEKGDIKGGVKYIPLFFIVSELVYYLALGFLATVLGGVTL